MNTRVIAVVGAVVLGLLLVRYLAVSRYQGAAPGASGSAGLVHLTDFDEALAKARSDNKLLVVDAMATWCGPCKMMDRDSWSNPDVQAWMNEHAVFAQVDVDQHVETAKKLKIEAMPTIIVFKDGQETGRVVGYRNASQLLSWLKSS
jgi:thiol:disulfide interchange protein